MKVEWIPIPIYIALGVVVAVLATTVFLSLFKPKKKIYESNSL